MGLGALQQFLQRRVIQPAQHQYLGARKQCAVEFERRVLGGRADQHHGAVLHHRQKGILLAAVEAMDFVNEQKRALPDLAPAAAPPRRSFSRSATPEKTADNCSK